MITRRGFLGLLGCLAAAPIAEPLTKTFFLPPTGGWVPTAGGLVVPGNQFLTVEWITQEALKVLKQNLVFASGFSRNYDESFALDGAKIGSTLSIRRPVQFSEAYAR